MRSFFASDIEGRQYVMATRYTANGREAPMGETDPVLRTSNLRHVPCFHALRLQALQLRRALLQPNFLCLGTLCTLLTCSRVVWESEPVSTLTACPTRCVTRAARGETQHTSRCRTSNGLPRLLLLLLLGLQLLCELQPQLVHLLLVRDPLAAHRRLVRHRPRLPRYRRSRCSPLPGKGSRAVSRRCSRSQFSISTPTPPDTGRVHAAALRARAGGGRAPPQPRPALRASGRPLGLPPPGRPGSLRSAPTSRRAEQRSCQAIKISIFFFGRVQSSLCVGLNR